MPGKPTPKLEVPHPRTQPKVDDLYKTAVRAWRERTSDMLTPEQPQQLLESFDEEHLLDLLETEAQRSHGGHYTIFHFTTGFKVAFGTPNMTAWCVSKGYVQLAAMPIYPTLKEAVIATLVSQKTFTDYFDGCPQTWWEAWIRPCAQ
jgi:hypothetical protein